MNQLKRIFAPKSIAVIGASNKKGSVGHSLIHNLTKEFKGNIYPVNPKRKTIDSLKAYKDISSIKKPIDLAIIAIPAPFVHAVVEECGKKGVGGLVIISAGFNEIGKEGIEMSNNILKTAKKYKMRIIGPNCLGFIRPDMKLNASFAVKETKPGKIAMISQSGALGTAILDWAIKHNIGLSYFVSIGSMIDISFDDLIEYFCEDKKTEAILIYMESVTKAKEFLRSAKKCSKKKPIFVLKVGRSAEGSSAAMSHTGSLTGNDEVFSAAFEKTGIIRLNTINEFFDTAKTLALRPIIPKSDKLTIITNAGGPGVIATDFLVSKGGKLNTITKSLKEKLDKVLPKSWSKHNPIDIIGDATPERYKDTIKLCLNDKNVDNLLILLTPQEMTKPTIVAEYISALTKKTKKPVFVSYMGGDDVSSGRKLLRKNDIPTFSDPEDAIGAFLNLYRFNEFKKRKQSSCYNFKPKKESAKKLINNILSEKRKTLTEKESKTLLSYYDINITNSFIAKSPTEATRYAKKLKFPVVMKILSPDILHKTDVGGVKTNINSETEAKKAYNDILKSVKKKKPKAKIEGVLVEKSINGNIELLIGAKKDDIFGHVIVFGSGGIYVELYKDTALALSPLNMNSSLQLIQNTKAYSLLKGYRGNKGINPEYIQKLLCRFSMLLADIPSIKELDINPYTVQDGKGYVLDAKVVLE